MSDYTNAIIRSADIDYGDNSRGILTVWLSLDFGGTGQNFGGYALYLPKSYMHHRKDGPCGHFIARCMEVAGVEKWSDMAGKPVRVVRDGISSPIRAIGHIVKDDWFTPSEDLSGGGDDA